VHCVVLTNVAERMRKQYNEELEGAMDDEDRLKIVNDPNILARTILGTTICKCCLRIVTLLTCISVYKGLVTDIVEYTNKPELPNLIRQFLHHQLSNDPNASDLDVSISTLPTLNTKIFLHSSASSVFFAPSDPCGLHGLRREQIRSMWQWRGGPSRQDTVLVNTGHGGNTQLPMSGYVAARVLFFFSFTYGGDDYCAALVWWYILTDDSGHRDEATGMWLVEREYRNEEPHLSVIHVDAILHAVHLLPFFGREPVVREVTQDNSLDRFGRFYVNKYVDHQAFEIL